MSTLKNAIGDGLQDDERVCTHGDKEEKRMLVGGGEGKRKIPYFYQHTCTQKTGQKGREANKEHKTTKIEEFFFL